MSRAAASLLRAPSDTKLRDNIRTDQRPSCILKNLDVLAQDFKVVTVIELVFLHCGEILTRIGRLRNCQSVCVVGTPGGVIVLRADAGSLDSVADSLREPAPPLGMTMLEWVGGGA